MIPQMDADGTPDTGGNPLRAAQHTLGTERSVDILTREITGVQHHAA
jgi:hypothetical protein